MAVVPGRARVVVIGAGQAGLATAYHLRRLGLVPGRDVVVLDAGQRPGGAWPHTWDGLRTFSPAAYSSLPGWMMPAWDDRARGYPTRDHVVDYLTRYEQRYDLEVRRPVRVRAVHEDAHATGGRAGFLVETDAGACRCEAVVSATGTWGRPFVPAVPGIADFRGRQLHTVDYRRPQDFAGQRVAIVGGGNSAAQVLAEVSTVATTVWCTQREPRLLPDDVDGRELFAQATARVHARERGEEHAGVGGLGDVVAVASVREARERGVLVARPMVEALTAHGLRWADGATERVDAVIWCTGFRADLAHLAPLRLRGHGGRVATDPSEPTRSLDRPGLHLVGYGDWTGPASATLVGVGRTARAAARSVARDLARPLAAPGEVLGDGS